MFYRILVLLVVVFASNAVAECNGVSCVDVKVTRLYVSADGDTVISTSGDESRLACDAGSAGYIKLDANASNYSSTYALLLAAHTTEHPLWIRTADTGACKIMYVVSDK